MTITITIITQENSVQYDNAAFSEAAAAADARCVTV
jgi:hypothetical protein